MCWCLRRAACPWSRGEFLPCMALLIVLCRQAHTNLKPHLCLRPPDAGVRLACSPLAALSPSV
jgi:hypothetical protein